MSDPQPPADRRQRWQAPPRPEWVSRINAEGAGMDIAGIVPLDADSLIATAIRESGQADFGDSDWEQPFRLVARALDEEAELTLMGRLMARSDALLWLQNRLRIEGYYRKHPEIEDQQIVEPLFIVGLPRSGTSILFEILAQDPGVRIPETWAGLFSHPLADCVGAERDALIARAQHLVGQWSRVVPEFAAMHEMGGRIPAECGLLMTGCFVSDHIASLHQTTRYDMHLATCSWEPAYHYHRRVLRLLQWKSPRKRWLLKAPNHLAHLPLLLATYPDARIVQTHRDPLKCMASATSLLGSLYWMRSDKAFDVGAFEDIILGTATAQRLERVMTQRDEGLVPPDQIVDSLYQDLMRDPIAAVARLYQRLGIELGSDAAHAMAEFLKHKPQGKFGAHSYQLGDAPELAREREYFRAYQTRYQVPNEL